MNERANERRELIGAPGSSSNAGSRGRLCPMTLGAPVM